MHYAVKRYSRQTDKIATSHSVASLVEAVKMARGESKKFCEDTFMVVREEDFSTLAHYVNGRKLR